MSEWITNRRPTLNDCNGSNSFVYNSQGVIVYYATVELGEAWKPIPNCEPYVKPQRFRVEETRPGSNRYAVYDNEDDLCCSFYLPTREAAERIAAIYEEAMP